MKKIMYVITQLELGGAQLMVLASARYFAGKGYEVVLVSNNRGILTAESAGDPSYKKYFLAPLKRELDLNSDIKALKALKSIMKKERPDIVHTHSSKAGILGRKAARSARVPLIVHTVHGFGFHYFRNGIMKRLAIMGERSAARNCHKLIFVSGDDMETARALCIGRKEQYELLRVGIDFEKVCSFKGDRAALRKELGLPEDKKIIINIAPFKRQKNLPLFIEIIKGVAEKKDDITALIIGDGESRSALEHIVEKSGLSGRVLMPGFKRSPYKWLAASDIYLSTSLWEGMPRTLIEALLLGKPVVASEIGGVKEIIKDGKNGFLFKHSEAGEAVQKLLLLCEDNDVFENMSKAAMKSIDREFSLEAMLEGLERLYNAD